VLAREAFITLAEKHDASLWDLFSVMGGLDSVKLWEEQGLAQKDKVHFTKKGYELVGNLFFDAFINAYNNKD
jgi:lysophospholipase L1-like esterase